MLSSYGRFFVRLTCFVLLFFFRYWYHTYPTYIRIRLLSLIALSPPRFVFLLHLPFLILVARLSSETPESTHPTPIHPSILTIHILLSEWFHFHFHLHFFSLFFSFLAQEVLVQLRG